MNEIAFFIATFIFGVFLFLIGSFQDKDFSFSLDSANSFSKFMGIVIILMLGGLFVFACILGGVCLIIGGC